MNRVVEWLRANVLIVVFAVLAVVAIVGIVLIRMAGAGLTAEMSARATQLKTIDDLMRTPVTPSEEIPPQPKVVTPGDIRQVQAYYGRLRTEKDRVARYVLELNRANHLPMLEGIFDEPLRDRRLPFQVPSRYRDAFAEMLGEHSPTSNVPQLDAGMPPTQAQIERALQQVEDEYLRRVFKSVNELTEAQLAELAKRKAERHLELVREQARSIHVYASQDINETFDVMAFSRDNPPPEEIWEAQMKLWIQQDLTRAIAVANRTVDPRVGVPDAPIKRLIRMEVPSGNVVAPDATPVTGAETTPEGRLEPDFRVSMTGRYSNPLYDVRWASLTILADAQRLPQFLDSLGLVNLMTVLRCDIEDIDEFEHLRDGYFYGLGDIVRVRLVVETIWLREWTTKMMPSSVLNAGVDAADTSNAFGAPGGQGFPGGGFGPMRPGMPGGPGGMRPGGMRPGGGSGRPIDEIN